MGQQINLFSKLKSFDIGILMNSS